MTTALPNRPTSGSDSVLADAPHKVSRVALVVRDLDRMSSFYQSVLGLHLLERGSGRVRLGNGASELLELRHDPGARLHSGDEAGLFHTAFLLPTRADLGAWLSHAKAQSIRLTGAADHLVSEAVYLNDPEGNGIEIYVDRPSSAWRWSGGLVEMATNPLDRDALVRAASGRAWSGFPEEGLVGHVHLQVGDLADADGFYRDLLGFDLTARYPGASFYGSGGYHHQLAGNIWNSRGASVRAGRTTGLAEVELLVADHVFDAARSAQAARSGDPEADRIMLHDPWGSAITLRRLIAPERHRL